MALKELRRSRRKVHAASIRFIGRHGKSAPARTVGVTVKLWRGGGGYGAKACVTDRAVKDRRLRLGPTRGGHKCGDTVFASTPTKAFRKSLTKLAAKGATRSGRGLTN